jgi:hypothetical protein
MRRLRTALVLAVAAVAVTGCSEQIDQTVNDLVTAALDNGIRAELENVGVSLDGDPACSTDFTRDGATVTGDADCTGKTTEGQSVEATFNGTLSTDGCDGSLTVLVNGETVVDVSEIANCQVDLPF